MSKIDRLSVSGVRSFGHLERQTITFFSPLTLIVGYNGSGKTTIIECLKYATTGDLPPNSKGGAFIHDPKLCGEREVMAQVKLRFKAPPDTTFVVNRSLQLTVKKTTRSQKTIDSTLRINRGGDVESVSNKEVQMNDVVPRYLGVAPAILDAVIFCHQDESLWPMSEPSALKKRFDEIFEAMKYTKAIDNLKVLTKKQKEERTLLVQRQGFEKNNKDKADRCLKLQETLEQEIYAMEEEYETLEKQSQEAAKQATQLRQEAVNAMSIVNDLSSKKGELGFREKAMEELEFRMKKLDEPDELLHDALSRYRERVARFEEEQEDNKLQYQHCKDDMAEKRQDMAKKLAEQGRHESDKAKYDRQVQSRVELVHDAAQIHSIRGFDSQLDERKVQLFYERIQTLLSDKRRELERLQTENAEEMDAKAAAITDLEAKKSQFTQKRGFAKQRITACEKRVAALQKDLRSVDVDEGAKALLDSEFENTEQRLQQATEELQAGDFDRKLQQENERLQQLEGEASRLSRELQEATRLLSERAQLDYRKEEVAEKRRKLTTLSTTWSDKLNAAVGTSWDPSTIERAYQSALQLKVRTHDEVSRKRDDLSQQLKTAQATGTNVRERAKRRNNEIDRCKSAVLKALRETRDPSGELGVENLPREIRDLEKDILIVEKDIFMTENMNKYYEDCRETMDKKNRCELCSRRFANDEEKSRLATKITRFLGDNSKELFQKDLSEFEAQMAQLRAVQPQYEAYTRLSSEKVESDKEIKDHQLREEEIVHRLEEMDEAVRGRREERQDLEGLGKTVLTIAQTHKDLVEAEAHVDRIVSQQQSSNTVRGTQEISELQEQRASDIKGVQDRISSLSGKRQRMRDAINSLELHQGKLKIRTGEAVRQLEKKTHYQDQIQTQKEDIVAEKEIIQQADKDLESIEPEISKARTIRDDALQRGRIKEKGLADERDSLASSVSELKMIDNDIKDYLDRGGPSELERNQRAIQSLEKAIKQIDAEMADTAARGNTLREEISNSGAKEQNIKDNLAYRTTVGEIEKLRGTIEELESRNAREDHDRLDQEAKEYEQERDQLNGRCGSLRGSMKTKDEELKRLSQEWDAEYSTAARSYREVHIKVETTKAAIQDLGRYTDALNNAIMKYHALKMEEVNRIAGELWQSTYQGTDIDTILIRSDSEGASGRSSYNYRVCMVKQDTEMDMRGRCSAGQKVLASIIIRLALAESFGVGCGLIALDEPTTNLDRDNIRSLAESLHRIIGQRRGQSNFQLIVITHDEEFLRHMRCSDFCDEFWRVSRDPRQNSRIDKQSISMIV